jgi:hypothetical protein
MHTIVQGNAAWEASMIDLEDQDAWCVCASVHPVVGNLQPGIAVPVLPSLSHTPATQSSTTARAAPAAH